MKIKGKKTFREKRSLVQRERERERERERRGVLYKKRKRKW